MRKPTNSSSSTLLAPSRSRRLSAPQLARVGGGADTVRSQAEKRLEQQRKDLTKNWAG